MKSNEGISVSFHRGLSDKLDWIVSLGILGIVGPGMYIWGAIELWHIERGALYLFLSCALMLVVGFVWGLNCIPMRLRIEGREIILTKMLVPLRISLDDVEEVKTTTISFVKGGLVSWHRPRYWGRCKHKSLGKVYCYIPAPFPERLVLIRTKNGQHYVFGCTCVDEFIEYVNSRILKGTIQ